MQGIVGLVVVSWIKLAAGGGAFEDLGQ